MWRALIHAEIADQQTTAGYTYVMVSEGSQSLALWHDGSIRLTTPVNTGIASAPTELGTFAVYEHIASGTMSGTNPDGSHYEDPGVPWISYFNGGDALHGFERAQYGFPQSLGCVEMPPATAGRGVALHADRDARPRRVGPRAVKLALSLAWWTRPPRLRHRACRYHEQDPMRCARRSLPMTHGP